MIKKCFAIYKRDLLAISKNYAALVVVIALCILPSLYAWFNIKASWDPYSESATRGVKIGIINEDEGANVAGKAVNIGNAIVDELKQNTQLGWQFTDANEARKALEQGEYYATITIPSNFSQNLTSIIGSKIQKGELIYTVNEKLNAIAPKLTDKGVTSLQSMVSEKIVESVSEAIFSAGNKVGIHLEEEIPHITTIYEQLVHLQSQLDNISETVDLSEKGVIQVKRIITQLEDDLPHIHTTIKDAQQLTKDIQNFMNTSQTNINEIAPTIKRDLQIVGTIATEIVDTTQSLREAIASQSAQIPDLVTALEHKVNSTQAMVNSLNEVLMTLNKILPNTQITTAITQLTTVSNDLTSANNLITQISTKLEAAPAKINPILEQMMTVGTDVSNVATNMYTNFDNQLLNPINEIINKAYNVSDDVTDILMRAQNSLPDIGNILTDVSQAVDKGQSGISYIKSILPKAEKMLDNMTNKLGGIKNSDDLKHLIQLLKVDALSRSEFLANPITIKEEVIYPMGNYGTSMTPFYTVLCLWVGGLLLVSILTVEAEGEYSPYEVYLGKLLLFMTLGLIQAIIVALGDLYLLKIYCKNPWLFILSNCLVGIIFATIVYSLVSVFGNIGKVVAIILLVLQVAGSGGTFPIQMIPHFFQVINPFLPFTYGISLNREAIGGVVRNIYNRDLVFLIIYMIIFLLMGIFLKKPINELLKAPIEKFKQSGIGE